MDISDRARRRSPIDGRGGGGAQGEDRPVLRASWAKAESRRHGVTEEVTPVSSSASAYSPGPRAGLGIRLGAGIDCALTDKLSIVFEPIGLLFNLASNVTYNIGGTTVTTNSGCGAQWVIWIGAAYRL